MKKVEHKFTNLIEILLAINKAFEHYPYFDRQRKVLCPSVNISRAIRILRSITPGREFILMTKNPKSEEYKTAAMEICFSIWPPFMKPLDKRGLDLIQTPPGAGKTKEEE